MASATLHDPQPESFKEIETKFDLPGGFEVPDLARFSRKDGRVEIDSVRLVSTYYDTSSLDLLRSRLTVRQRAAAGATTDVGWQLKVPGDGFRTELHWPTDDAHRPPPAMLALLQPFLDGRGLRPAVRLEVTRIRHRLVTGSGELRAELADDEVHAIPLGSLVRTAVWREVEVELGTAGDQSLLTRIGRALLKAGAHPSTSRSKLARAVSGRDHELMLDQRPTAGSVLGQYVAAQADVLVAGHFAIRGDVADSIHQTRVAARRLRSTLRTFSRFYDEAAATELEAELAWYAGALGAVRDLEVLRARFADHLRQLPSTIADEAKRPIDDRLATELAAARAGLLAAQSGARYGRLLARIGEWRDDPPYTKAARRPASALTKPVDHADRALDKGLIRATQPGGTDTEMHSARKAGKRARYANEVVRGGRSSKRSKKLQDVLGEFQDSVVAAEAVESLLRAARESGEDTFIYGVLFAEERARADAAREQVRRMT